MELTYGEGSTTALRTYAKNMKQVSLPASCTTIAERAFYECRSIQNITLPEHLASIGKEAFTYCSGLGRIVLPASLTAIGVDAFRYCDNLINLEYAEGTRTALRTYANKMASVTIPPSCISFADDAFKDCAELASIYIKNLESWNCIFYDQASNPFCCDHFIYLNGEVINDLITNFGGDIAQHAFSHVKGLKSVTLTGQITGIGREAFAGCTELESVVVGNKASRVADKAFAGCTSLQTVRLGSGNQQIGKEAFYGCTALNSVHLGGNEESIGNDAFHNCNSLPEIRIPASVKTIGQGAFENCYALSLANIPEGVQSIKPYTFRECRVLEQITIPASVTSIGTSAFSGCASLSKIDIPESVQSIADHAFYGCSQLHHIYIGAGVQSIGAKAFADCSYLKDLFVYPTKVPATDASAFDGSITESIKPFVPAESVEAYAATSPWNKLMSVDDLATAPVYVTGIEIDPEVMILSLDDLEPITATVFPANASNQNLVWNSSDNGVASVTGTKTKRVFPMSEGVATITAYAQDNNGARAQAIVIVTDNYVPVTSLSLDKSELTLTEGDEYHFTATTAPASATYAAVKWSSSDEDILTVSSDGLITAIKAGAATVTATTADGTALVASCDVTIKRPTYSSLAGLGDVDDDGVIDQDDLQAVSDLILGKRGGVDDSFDVNHDGQINVADAISVINNMKEYGVAVPGLDMIKLDRRNVEIAYGGSGHLNAYTVPFGCQCNLIWESSDESVIRIDEYDETGCSYTAIGAGEAIITVHSADNDNIQTSCNIFVCPLVFTFKLIDHNRVMDELFEYYMIETLDRGEKATFRFEVNKKLKDGRYTNEIPEIEDLSLCYAIYREPFEDQVIEVDDNGTVTALNYGSGKYKIYMKSLPEIWIIGCIDVEHPYVDLGIKNENGYPVYWASYNLGANKSYETGSVFLFGDATPDPDEAYNYYWPALIKYDSDLTDVDNDGLFELRTEIYHEDAAYTMIYHEDAAYDMWNTLWRMPSKLEMDQLVNECIWEQTVQEGIKGYKVSNKNDNSKFIFLPSVSENGSIDYWTSSWNFDDELGTYYLGFDYNVYYLSTSLPSVSVESDWCQHDFRGIDYGRNEATKRCIRPVFDSSKYYVK